MNKLRQYKTGTPEYELYKEMHKNQTVDFVNKKLDQYSKPSKNLKYSMKEALRMLDDFIDPSDPDIDLPNSVHAYQTAERIRKKYPKNYQFQICGLIHDVGKILFKLKEPNWAVVGDTFVVGCEYGKSIVYYDTLMENPDFDNPKYRTKNGIYEEGCGIKNLKLSFGHDEYLYMVLKNNDHKLEDRYLDMIRYHSFYPWHTGGDYSHFMKKGDENLLKDILEFNKFDLYSKEDSPNIGENVIDYYDKLLDEYFPGVLLF